MLVLGPKKQRDLLFDLMINLKGCTVVSNTTEGPRHSLYPELIHAFVISELDLRNAVLSGYPDKALNKLQLVLNTAARILTRTPKYIILIILL